MPALINRKPENRFLALFVGRSGSGKTVAEVSFPKPLHVEDFDGRIGGAQIEQPDGKQVSWLPLDEITYDYYPPRKQGLIDDINKHLEELQNLGQLAPAVKFIKTHVTDSITNECYAFICQALPLTHFSQDNGRQVRRGRWLGAISMAGPEDYGFESQGIADYVSWLKTLPIQNVIVSAHSVDVYGKPEDDNGNELPYANSIVVGKKLSIRDKISENIQTNFDHIFEFERDVEKFYVTFKGKLARTSYSWLPSGRHEWTNRNFYEFMMGFKKDAKNT